MSIPGTLKEAVSEALIGHLYQRISGGGDQGRVLYRVRPQEQLVSGFIIPPRRERDLDDVQRSIVITSHGLRFRLRKGGSGVVRVEPTAYAYVRTLPTMADIILPGMRPSPVLRREVQHSMRDWVRAQLQNAPDPPDGTSRESQALHLRETWLRNQGVPETLFPHVQLGELDTGKEEPQTPEEVRSASPNTSSSPGIEKARINALFDPLPVPHRWERVEFALPALELPMDDTGVWETLANAHGILLQREMELQLRAWAVAPNHAGQMYRPGIRCEGHRPAELGRLSAAHKSW